MTGDTKVVNRGSADKLFITTSGVGLVPEGIEISASERAPGDVILLSGSIGDHGMAVMSVREGLEFEGEIRSDTASFAHARPRHARSGRSSCAARSDTRRPGDIALRDRRGSSDGRRDRGQCCSGCAKT